MNILEHIVYDPVTGIFLWKTSGTKRIAGTVAGCNRSDGYKQIKFEQRVYYGHRLAWLICYGYLPSEIDHIDGNPANNAINNLRLVTRKQQCANSRDRRNGALPKGVKYDKRRGHWSARILTGRKERYLGRFATPYEAAFAYQKAAESLHGDYSVHKREHKG